MDAALKSYERHRSSRFSGFHLEQYSNIRRRHYRRWIRALGTLWYENAINVSEPTPQTQFWDSNACLSSMAPSSGENSSHYWVLCATTPSVYIRQRWRRTCVAVPPDTKVLAEELPCPSTQEARTEPTHEFKERRKLLDQPKSSTERRRSPFWKASNSNTTHQQ
jgi:hypothetical protein